MTSNSSVLSSASTSIRWRRLGGIVAVQSAITLAWVTYGMYLPDLLVQLGFAKGLAGTLLIIEHALEVIIEPVFGGLSDRSKTSIGSRLPLITIGVILTSAFFIALPAIATFVPAASPLRWAFPITAVLWASAMAMFRSPVLSLLREASPKLEMPLAASCLTLAQQLVGALRFTAYGIILSLGPLFTFAIGSIAFLAAAAVLRRVTTPTPQEPIDKTLPPLSPWSWVALVGMALGIALGIRFVFADLSQLFAGRLGAEQVSLGLLGFNLLMACWAIPAGKMATKVGSGKTMLAGLLGTAFLLGAVSLVAAPVLLWAIGLLLMALSLTTVLNGMVPVVLSLVPDGRSGLGVGIYFGAFGGAISLFSLAFADLESLAMKASLGAVCFVGAGICLGLGKRARRLGSRLSSTRP